MGSEELARRLVLVSVGGAAGAVARYFVARLALAWWGPLLPWGTALANLLGALLFGLLWGAFAQRGEADAAWRLLLLTGFLGSFTTFSTLMFESVQLFSSDRSSWAVANLGGQLVLGVACIYLGSWLGRLLAGAQ